MSLKKVARHGDGVNGKAFIRYGFNNSGVEHGQVSGKVNVSSGNVYVNGKRIARQDDSVNVTKAFSINGTKTGTAKISGGAKNVYANGKRVSFLGANIVANDLNGNISGGSSNVFVNAAGAVNKYASTNIPSETNPIVPEIEIPTGNFNSWGRNRIYPNPYSFLNGESDGLPANSPNIPLRSGVIFDAVNYYPYKTIYTRTAVKLDLSFLQGSTVSEAILTMNCIYESNYPGETRVYTCAPFEPVDTYRTIPALYTHVGNLIHKATGGTRGTGHYTCDITSAVRAALNKGDTYLYLSINAPPDKEEPQNPNTGYAYKDWEQWAKLSIK